MNTILLTFIITCSIVYITDVLNFQDNLATEITRMITGTVKYVHLKPKILNCSLCQSFWINLIILLVLSPQFVYFALIWAALTKYILYAYQLIDLTITRVFDILIKFLKG